MEAEAEAVKKIWKRKQKRFLKKIFKWKRKRKRIFYEKKFGSGSGSDFFLKKILEAEAEAFSKSTASKTLLITQTTVSLFVFHMMMMTILSFYSPELPINTYAIEHVEAIKMARLRIDKMMAQRREGNSSARKRFCRRLVIWR